ncbi:MAG: hypothetical protein R2874_10345 [Desulfobacterales bacterium]
MFARHPVIDVDEVVRKIDAHLNAGENAATGNSAGQKKSLPSCISFR